MKNAQSEILNQELTTCFCPMAGRKTSGLGMKISPWSFYYILFIAANDKREPRAAGGGKISCSGL
jgi:hypothetical protein